MTSALTKHDLKKYEFRLNKVRGHFTDIAEFVVHPWGSDGYYCIEARVDPRVSDARKQITLLTALEQLNQDNAREGVSARGKISVLPEKQDTVVFGYDSLEDLEATIATQENALWHAPAEPGR